VGEKTALASDLLDVQARLRRARYERTSASNTLATHEEELNDLLGRPVESDLTLDSDIALDFVLPTPAEAMQRALAARPDLQAANLQAKQADLSRREKKAEYIPSLSLESTYAAIHDSSLPIGGTSYAEVGVQLKWEPFDWGRKHHELTEKSEIVEQSRLNITDLEAKAHIEVNAALRNAEAASELLQSETLSVEAAEQSLKVAQQKYAEHAVLCSWSHFKCSSDPFKQQLMIEWFCKELDCTLSHRLNPHSGIPVSRDEDDWNIAFLLFQPGLQLQTRHLRHTDIKN
jgi:outer membrane protein